MELKYLISILLLISALILSGCNEKKISNDVCGDDRCTGQETKCNCNKDCGPWEGSLRVMKECSNAAPLQDTEKGGCTNALDTC